MQEQVVEGKVPAQGVHAHPDQAKGFVANVRQEVFRHALELLFADSCRKTIFRGRRIFSGPKAAAVVARSPQSGGQG